MTQDASDRYHAAAHAMQSGVAMEMQHGSRDTEPKHLRVGVNSAMVDSSAMAELLIAKGVITEDEYAEAIASGMEREAAIYAKRLSERLGIKVTLA
jgi:fructose/tagatose bisphosphate aldolase